MSWFTTVIQPDYNSVSLLWVVEQWTATICVSSVCVRPCLAWISPQWIMRTEERLHERPVHSTQDTSTVRRHSADPSQLRQTYSNFPPLQAQWGTFVHMTNLCAIITKITLL